MFKTRCEAARTGLGKVRAMTVISASDLGFAELRACGRTVQLCLLLSNYVLLDLVATLTKRDPLKKTTLSPCA
jgi:hypothetical protein